MGSTWALFALFFFWQKNLLNNWLKYLSFVVFFKRALICWITELNCAKGHISNRTPGADAEEWQVVLIFNSICDNLLLPWGRGPYLTRQGWTGRRWAASWRWPWGWCRGWARSPSPCGTGSWCPSASRPRSAWSTGTCRSGEQGGLNHSSFHNIMNRHTVGQIGVGYDDATDHVKMILTYSKYLSVGCVFCWFITV